jgi:hypothetical protein
MIEDTRDFIHLERAIALEFWRISKTRLPNQDSDE